MKKKLLFIGLIFSILLISEVYTQTPRGEWEIFMRTKKGPATITFYINSFSSKVWEAHTSDIDSTYLTTLTKYVNPDDITMPGNDSLTNSYGWDSDDWPGCGYEIGRGYYEVRVSGKSAELIVDCYGTDFTDDIFVLYDYSKDKFYVDGNEVDSINLYDDVNGLQPTAPKDFDCTNPTSYGSNPQFSWSRPDQPTGNTLTYYIYRNEGAGYRNIGWTKSTSYTDTGCELDRNGNTTYYYVKAKGSNSPLSDASNIVEINTDIASKPLPGSSDNKKEDKEQAGSMEPLLMASYM